MVMILCVFVSCLTLVKKGEYMFLESNVEVVLGAVSQTACSLFFFLNNKI